MVAATLGWFCKYLAYTSFMSSLDSDRQAPIFISSSLLELNSVSNRLIKWLENVNTNFNSWNKAALSNSGGLNRLNLYNVKRALQFISFALRYHCWP